MQRPSKLIVALAMLATSGLPALGEQDASEAVMTVLFARTATKLCGYTSGADFKAGIARIERQWAGNAEYRAGLDTMWKAAQTNAKVPAEKALLCEAARIMLSR